MMNITLVGRHSYKLLGALVVLAAIALGSVASVAYAQDDKAHKDRDAHTVPVMNGVEVNIGSNGSVLVRGAKVTGISGSTINANTALGSSVLSWVVQTDSATGFSASRGSQIGLANIRVGDTISFNGSLDQSVSGLTVKAKHVKDWTNDAAASPAYDGVITAINASLSSFTIRKGSATSTVQTSSTTVFKKDGANASFADLFVNAKVKIAGVLNASSTTIASMVEIASDGAKDKNGTKNGWFWWNSWAKFWHR